MTDPQTLFRQLVTLIASADLAKATIRKSSQELSHGQETLTTNFDLHDEQDTIVLLTVIRKARLASVPSPDGSGEASGV